MTFYFLYGKTIPVNLCVRGNKIHWFICNWFIG